MRHFFFFQAEDGIRDGHVTGVQTCALPIWFGAGAEPLKPLKNSRASNPGIVSNNTDSRSEERRVGKECRSQRAREDDMKERRREKMAKRQRWGTQRVGTER